MSFVQISRYRINLRHVLLLQDEGLDLVDVLKRKLLRWKCKQNKGELDKHERRWKYLLWVNL